MNGLKPYRSGFWTRLGGKLQDLGTGLMERRSAEGIWIDVGAHLGEQTIGFAESNPGLTVFAFEPNWRAARKIMGRLRNFVVIPMAVAEQEGHTDFHITLADEASSLLPFDPVGLSQWDRRELLRVETTVQVPTIRLDTFMNLMEIRTVEFLKIDAQGADLSVLRSAGARLQDVKEITLEVDVSPVRVYQGSAGTKEITQYLNGQGFALRDREVQVAGREENLTFVRDASNGLNKRNAMETEKT
jgi:FkbM family methyltransferase